MARERRVITAPEPETVMAKLDYDMPGATVTIAKHYAEFIYYSPVTRYLCFFAGGRETIVHGVKTLVLE